MKRFKKGLSMAAVFAGMGLAANAGALNVPDTGTCNNATDCLKIQNLHAQGWAVTGWAPAYALVGVSTGASGKGVWGQANADQASIGVYGSADTGTGVYGVSGASYGVFGTTSSASSYGVYGLSTNGVAIKGYGYNRGVYGQATATTNGIGVTGYAPQNGRGVYGIIAPPGPGTAVYGENTNTGAGAYAGYFWGNVYVTGTLTQGNSDSRLKKNIQPIAAALDQVLKLRGVTYEWKDPDQHTGSGLHAGFIAQDVEKVFPHWVGTDDKGFKTLSTTELDGLVVESIRSLKTENDTLRKRVAALEARGPTAAAGVNGSSLLGFGLMILASAFVVSRRRPAPSSA